MAVTVSDVARRAGVSVSTVSRALAHSRLVSPETTSLVEATATKLGYRPNLLARGLSTGRSECLGLVLPDLENPFFSSIAKGIQAHARRRGYSVLMADTDEDATLEADLVRRLASQSDGVIVCSPRSNLAGIQTLVSQVPLVLVNRPADNLTSVIVDETDRMRQAVRHLAALGHTRIAYVGGPKASWSDQTRHQAFLDTMATVPGADAVDLGHFQPFYHSGAAAADLAAVSGATAVIAYNDLIAIGLVQRLQARGLAVPRDLSVVGIDDIPQASWSSPPLTTVSTVRRLLARAAVDALLDHTDEPTKHVVPVELIVRASTGEAPPAAEQRTSPSHKLVMSGVTGPE